MKPLVIYHNTCADGFGAAFAAWLQLRDRAEYLPWQYGKELQIDVTGHEVFILDFSFPRETMGKIFSAAASVVWLDHHATVFKDWGVPLDEPANASDLSLDEARHYVRLNNSKSGALLAWEYFNQNTAAPMLFRLIDDYDRWQFKLNGTKEINKALWAQAPWSFEQWKEVLDGGYEATSKLKAEGAALLRAHNQNVTATVERTARLCVINEALKGLAANCPSHLTSDVGHKLAVQSGTFGLCWYISKENKCLCSLRSTGDYDVSVIAKRFGGGGHKNAAGFEVPVTTLLEWTQ